MHFTQEGMNPNERTLDIIKKIAYTYRVIKWQTERLCLSA